MYYTSPSRGPRRRHCVSHAYSWQGSGAEVTSTLRGRSGWAVANEDGIQNSRGRPLTLGCPSCDHRVNFDKLNSQAAGVKIAVGSARELGCGWQNMLLCDELGSEWWRLCARPPLGLRKDSMMEGAILMVDDFDIC